MVDEKAFYAAEKQRKFMKNLPSDDCHREYSKNSMFAKALAPTPPAPYADLRNHDTAP